MYTYFIRINEKRNPIEVYNRLTKIRREGNGITPIDCKWILESTNCPKFIREMLELILKQDDNKYSFSSCILGIVKNRKQPDDIIKICRDFSIKHKFHSTFEKEIKPVCGDYYLSSRFLKKGYYLGDISGLHDKDLSEYFEMVALKGNITLAWCRGLRGKLDLSRAWSCKIVGTDLSNITEFKCSDTGKNKFKKVKFPKSDELVLKCINENKLEPDIFDCDFSLVNKLKIKGMNDISIQGMIDAYKYPSEMDLTDIRKVYVYHCKFSDDCDIKFKKGGFIEIGGHSKVNNDMDFRQFDMVTICNSDLRNLEEISFNPKISYVGINNCWLPKVVDVSSIKHLEFMIFKDNNWEKVEELRISDETNKDLVFNKGSECPKNVNVVEVKKENIIEKTGKSFIDMVRGMFGR